MIILLIQLDFVNSCQLINFHYSYNFNASEIVQECTHHHYCQFLYSALQCYSFYFALCIIDWLFFPDMGLYSLGIGYLYLYHSYCLSKYMNFLVEQSIEVFFLYLNLYLFSFNNYKSFNFSSYMSDSILKHLIEIIPYNYTFSLLYFLLIILTFGYQNTMNLLKGLGGSGNLMGSMGANKPLANKNNYFSNIKLQEQTNKQKPKQNPKGEKKKGPPKDFIPTNFALNFEPPTIILQYKNPENNKLYHHEMRIKKLKKDTNTKDALDFLKKKHYHYFIPKVIDEEQIQKLIQKLKKGIPGDDKSQMHNVQQQDCFEYDYDDDFENL